MPAPFHCSPSFAVDRLVKVNFFMEALCPFCAAATINTVKPLSKNGLFDIMELQYIAFGNAKNTSVRASIWMCDHMSLDARMQCDARCDACLQGHIQCQHGSAECLLNRVIGCVTHLHPSQTAWFPFVACLESAYALALRGEYVGFPAAAKRCAEKHGILFAPIIGCVKGARLEPVEAQLTRCLCGHSR